MLYIIDWELATSSVKNEKNHYFPQPPQPWIYKEDQKFKTSKVSSQCFDWNERLNECKNFDDMIMWYDKKISEHFAAKIWKFSKRTQNSKIFRIFVSDTTTNDRGDSSDSENARILTLQSSECDISLENAQPGIYSENLEQSWVFLNRKNGKTCQIFAVAMLIDRGDSSD